MQNVEKPVTVLDESWPHKDRTVTTHPSFAQIRASRVSGATNLYGSDFSHHNYITVTICRSRLYRDLYRDWHFGEDDIIEVALSEAQWATFVSAMNVGAGTPCTIQHIDRIAVPALPDPEPRADQCGDEMKSKTDGMMKKLNNLASELEGMGLPKGKTKELLSRINSVAQDIESNIPFIVTSFDKHMERTVEAAKTEIHGYMTGVIQRAGIEAIKSDSGPLLIERE